MSDTTKTIRTAGEVLSEVMERSPYNANFSLSRPYILEAMERYAEQEVRNSKEPIA